MEKFDLKRSDLILSIEQGLDNLGRIYPKFLENREHNEGTPRRIADMWIEMFKGLGEPDFIFTTFENKGGNDLIVLKDIEFSSMCMHHFMPFSGVAHIAYIPGERICGISKLARVVDYVSARPQVQEQLGDDIVQFIIDHLNPICVYVVIESKHSCVACRGAKSRNSTMITHHKKIDPLFPFEKEMGSFLRGIDQ